MDWRPCGFKAAIGSLLLMSGCLLAVQSAAAQWTPLSPETPPAPTVLTVQAKDQPPVQAKDQPPAPAKDQPPAKDDLFKLDIQQLGQVPVAPAANAPAVSIQQQVSTVSRQESTVLRSPAAVFVVTQEMIRRSGATSIPEVLRMVPGLNVVRSGSNSWGVGARGFSGTLVNKMLVQVDGRIVYNPIFSGVFWDTVDVMLQDVERIEVIRGPGASVWGANAVNGIINIITKTAADTQGGLITGGGGTQERASGGVRYGDKIGDDLYYRVYGKARDYGSLNNALGDLHDGWQQGRVGMRMDWVPNDRDTFTLQADAFDEQAGLISTLPTLMPTGLPPFSPSSFALTSQEKQTLSGKDVLWRWSHKIDKDSDWRLQIYYDNFALHRPDTKFDINTFDVDFQHQFPLTARQKIIYGVGYRLQNVVVQPVGPDTGITPIQSAPPTRDLILPSAFIQDQVTLVEDHLYFTAGSKFLNYTYAGFQYQPTARLLWTPDEKQAAWAAVSRAVRTPSLLEEQLFLTIAPPAAVTRGGIPAFLQLQPNTGFVSEVLMAYELGYRQQVTDSFSWDIAAFANDYQKLEVGVFGQPQSLLPTMPGVILPITVQNRMVGQTYGVELAANWKVNDWWRIYGAYTFLDMHLRADPTLPAATRASSEAATGQSPRNQVFLQSSWDLTQRMQLDLMARYIDNLPAFTPPVNKYIEIYLRLGWKFNNLELSVIGMNLLNNHHVESGTAQVPRSVYGMMTYRW